MKVTVREVAKAANVSVGTVSRALRGDPTVNGSSRARIEAAASSLNYVRLRQRSRRMEAPLAGRNIGLILLGMDRTLETLPVVACALHGAEAAVAAAGGTLILAEIPDLQRVPAALENNRIDGLVLKGALQGRAVGSACNDLMRRLRNVPSVWLLGRPEGCWGDSVTANDAEVGRLAAQHLADAGHKVVAFVNPKADHVTFLRRECSFLWHCARLGLSAQRFVGSAPDQWELPLRPVRDVASVDGLIDQVLAASPKPTAIFTPADSIAALVYRSLASRGMQAGRDMGVISCNNERPIVAGLYPTLTTLDTHAEQIGRRAVDQLVWRMAHPEGVGAELGVGPTLVEGDSVRQV